MASKPAKPAVIREILLHEEFLRVGRQVMAGAVRLESESAKRAQHLALQKRLLSDGE